MRVATMPVRQRSSTMTHARPVSELALLAGVSEAFRQTGYGQLRRLDIECEADSVILAGRVPTYFLKQLAQAVALGVSGVACVDNGIEVVGDESLGL